MIRNLSKGYRQRVGLAQALIGFPEVIILDEPTVGLDPQQILEIRTLIRSLREDHIVILSSHILSEVSEICDEVMIISHGSLVASGSPAELEKQVSKTMTIKMSILGDEAAVRGAVAGINHVSKIATSGVKDSNGGIAVTIETDSADDIRADIAKSLAVAGLPVLSMIQEEKSLEDVFLKVTTETPGMVSNRKKEKTGKKVKVEENTTTEAKQPSGNEEEK